MPQDSTISTSPTQISASQAETVTSRKSVKVDRATTERNCSTTSRNVDETTSRKQTTKERRKPEYVSKFDFSIILVSTFIGVSNITRFPANSFKYGGVSYIIVYTAVFLLYGLPMVTIDFVTLLLMFVHVLLTRICSLIFSSLVISGAHSVLAYIGQFTQSPAVLAYWKFAPITVGLTAAGQLQITVQALSDIVLVVRAIRVFSAYAAGLRIAPINGMINKQCITTARTRTLLTESGRIELASSQLFLNEVLNSEGEITNFAQIDPWRFIGLSAFLFVSLLLALINVKKCVLILKINALLMIFFVALIFLSGIFCPPKYLSIRPSTFLKNTQWNAMFQIETWMTAIYHVTVSMNLGSTATTTVANYNHYNTNYIPWALLAAFVDYFIGISMAVGMSFVTSALEATLFEVTVADLNQNSAVFLFGLLPQTLSYHSHALAAVAMFFAIPFCVPPAIVFARVIMLNLELLTTRTSGLLLWKIGGIVSVSILLPLFFSFQNGDLLFDWLSSFDDLMGTSLVFLQIALLHGCYGTTQIKYDLDSMMFYGSNSTSARKLCHLLVWLYDYVIPIANIFVICYTIVSIQNRMDNAKGTLSHIGSMLSVPTIFCSLLMGVGYPLYFTWTRPAHELLRVQESHPSYMRLRVDTTDSEDNI